MEEVVTRLQEAFLAKTKAGKKLGARVGGREKKRKKGEHTMKVRWSGKRLAAPCQNAQHTLATVEL